jgi:hypothetical protein
MFPCSHERFFYWTDEENFKKQEGKNGGKEKKRFPCTWRFPYLFVLHWLGTPSGYYYPHVTLPLENPLVWEPPYNKIQE